MPKSTFTLGEVISMIIAVLKRHYQTMNLDRSEIASWMKVALTEIAVFFKEEFDIILFTKESPLTISAVYLDNVATFDISSITADIDKVVFLRSDTGTFDILEYEKFRSAIANKEFDNQLIGAIRETTLYVYPATLIDNVSLVYTASLTVPVSESNTFDFPDRIIPLVIYWTARSMLQSDGKEVPSILQDSIKSSISLISGVPK